ncbi:MAG TPA: hypothetical protein VMN35_08470 [Gaiellaceae bacterium]|nr:hypothetical protein [Gaiellaceae bacterium]
MTDALESARIKLARANLHAGIGRREARRFFTRHPEPAFDIHPDSDEWPVSVGDVFRCKVVVIRGWPDLPPSFAARFGDAICNYRCALDHVAWRLVCDGLTPPSKLTKRQRTRVQFPIYTEEAAFDENIEGRLPGVSKAVTDYVKSLHRYVGGQTTNNRLTALADLSNDDKHRTLTVIATVLFHVRHDITFTDCILIRPGFPPKPLAVKDDAVVLRLECRVTGPKPQVTVNLQPTFHIALEDGRGFGDVLGDIQSEVTQVLDAPEILAAIR